MSNAFAFMVMKDLDYADRWAIDYTFYLEMCIVAARRIREVGYNNDIVLVSNCMEFIKLCEAENITFIYRDIIYYKALYQYKCKAWHLSLFDMQKIHYWSLSEYESVLALDADILATDKIFKEWNIPRVGVICAKHGGINSGMMLIRPCIKTYYDLIDTVIHADFDPILGWNSVGVMTTPCGSIEKWNFQAANASQGFIPYYFNQQLTSICDLVSGKFMHYCGALKYEDDHYSAEYKRLLNKMYN